MELRSKLSSAFLALSAREVGPEALKLANEKMAEVLNILRKEEMERASK